MQEKESIPITADRFMQTFKKYKSNNPKPTLDDVITVEKSSTNQVMSTAYTGIEDPRAEVLGLKNSKEWQVFALKQHPGLLFIRNPFTALGQRYWIRKCLEEYPKKPNKLNIDIEIRLEDWWRECFRNGECDRQLQKKLRWTTLGYHHNWDTKVYTESNKSKFPEDLAELSDVLAKCLGYTDFKAEAAIVNYYHMNSTLSAHTDHSEVNLKAPLFSFSFGQSAIFLIGGRDKSIEPSALLINSGDVVVMSEEARLCYHAVPKILPATDSPWDILDIPNTEIMTSSSKNINFKYMSQSEDIISDMKENIDNKWHRFRDYIKESRINMNVRQVLNGNQSSILTQ